MPAFTVRSLLAYLGSALLFPLPGACQSASNTPLEVTFGNNGLQTLAYQGTTLADLGAHPGDGFYVGHMKATDLNGNPLSGGQYGWGETNSGKHWDAASKTWEYTFGWGTLTVQYQVSGSNLNLLTTVTNNANSGVIFDGASVFPVVLHLPQLPTGFGAANYPQMSSNTTGPGVTVADWGSGELAVVAPDASKLLFSGFWPAPGSGNVPYATEISGTTPDGTATFQPHGDRAVRPGQTDHYTVSLRFAPSGTSPGTLAADAYKSWAATYPSTLSWTDRRPVGTVYLASSPQGDASRPGGFPTNPRRYFNSSGIDITTSAGLQAFQAQLLHQASAIASNSGQLGAQGVITWDIEGEQYPQATSYVCEPDQIATVSPEMESTVNIPGSPWLGKKLDDAYFSILRSAGLRVGVCIRPQHFTLSANGTAQQAQLPAGSILAELTRKARYAHDRWGATLFYVDSTVDTIGTILPAALFQQLHAALPDSLFIPEETTPLDYAYTAPFKSFLDLGAVGTDPTIHFPYPHAFSAVLVNDVDAAKLAAAHNQLVAQVRSGDILMAHVDYWQANNPTVVAIYHAAGVATSGSSSSSPSTGSGSSSSSGSSGSSTSSGGSSSGSSSGGASSSPGGSSSSSSAPAPAPTGSSKIAIGSPSAGQTVSGTLNILGVINDTLDAAGSHLIVDGYDLMTTRLTNAPYIYALDTHTLPNGSHTLQLWGHDTNNQTLLSSPVSVSVHN